MLRSISRGRQPARGLVVRLSRARLLLSALFLAVYVAVVVVVVVNSLGGVPASREVLVLLILGGFATVSITSRERSRRLVAGVLFDWLPFGLMLALYDLIRGHADGLWLHAHAKPQIAVDRWLGDGTIPTVWLQRHLWHGGAHLRWYDYLAWLSYMSYFFATLILLAVVWWRSRAAFRRLAVMVVLLAFAGCTTYVLYPAVPPWLAAYRGQIPHVLQVIPAVNSHIPIISFQPLWHKGRQYANNVAAIPSLHAGFTMLFSLYVGLRTRSRVRYVVWLYPLVMAFALVYSAEHYVTDILIGWIYAIVVFVAVNAVADRRVVAQPLSIAFASDENTA
jgi:PAP2 superfamily